jgi:hypothetical protein
MELDPMTILAPISPACNANPVPSANPRDSWPDWTDDDRWEPAPDPDDYRPTTEPDFIPTPEEESEAVGLLNESNDLGPNHLDWDAMANDSLATDRVCRGPIF